VIRRIRYCLTRMSFLAMGLRISKWRKLTEQFWGLGIEDRNRILETIIRNNMPLNSEGDRITSLEGLKTAPSLIKRRYREINERPDTKFNFSRKTSGTTGEPTKVVLSREDLSRMLGVRDYCFRNYGIRLGDREARFWGRPGNGLKSSLRDFILNRKVCCPTGEEATELLAEILTWSPDYLYGYASLLLEAASLVEKHSLPFNPPKCVICTAETILPAQKEYLGEIFKAPVIEEYGATEFDIVAFECKSGHRHLVNPWLVVLDDASSLLISDVSRRSASLVNYVIGDSGKIEDSECHLIGDSKHLAVLEGRSIHRFAYIDSDTRFHSVDLAYAINEYQRRKKEVFNFGITQVEYGVLDLHIDPIPLSGVDGLRSYIQDDIRKKTGHDILINVYPGRNTSGKNEKSYFIQRICVASEQAKPI